MLTGVTAKIGEPTLKRRCCVNLRQLQNKTRCPTSYLRHVVTAMTPFMKEDAIPHNITMADKSLLAEAGVKMCELFSCSNSQCGLRKVWSADVPEECPQCGKSMRDKKGKLQPVYYFPLVPRLRALLTTATFREMLSFEEKRTKNVDYFTDVYDSPAWENLFVGVPEKDRCGLLFCMDGYEVLGDSHIPAEFCCLSLPPWERYKARNMFLYLLIPKHLNFRKF